MQQAPAPKVSFVSLGCPKALVDSERIITRLRAEGYELARKHDGADIVIVNTCGFLDSAKQESLGAIGEATKDDEHKTSINAAPTSEYAGTGTGTEVPGPVSRSTYSPQAPLP